MGGGAGQAVPHTPGRRWSSIAVLARTNAQLAAGAGGHGGGERAVPGGRIGPGTGQRRAGRRLAPPAPITTTMRTRRPRSTATRSSSRRSTAPRDCSGTRCVIIGLSAGLMPLASAQTHRRGRRGAPPPLRRPHPRRGRAVVQLVRGPGRAGVARVGADPQRQSVAGTHRTDDRPAHQGGGADRGVRMSRPGWPSSASDWPARATA